MFASRPLAALFSLTIDPGEASISRAGSDGVDVRSPIADEQHHHPIPAITALERMRRLMTGRGSVALCLPRRGPAMVAG